MFLEDINLNIAYYHDRKRILTIDIKKKICKYVYLMLSNILKYISNNFSNPSGIGGDISTGIMNLINQKQYKAVLKNLKLEPNNSILDIGFGNGYLLKKIIRQNISVKIYGIEISKDMVQKVQLKNIHSIDSGILKLDLANINKTLLENDFFDKAYTVNTIYFWKEIEKCFSEIKRILKPNGIFINVIYTKEYLGKILFTKYDFNKYSVQEIEEMTKGNRMEIIETIEIIKNKSYCIISKKQVTCKGVRNFHR